MTETRLWGHIRPLLGGKFQKLSDQFSLGVPDVIGTYHGKPVAFELKQLKGKKVRRVKFRPLQVSWLTEWRDAGGWAGVWSTTPDGWVLVHTVDHADLLESGGTLEVMVERALLAEHRPVWPEFVERYLRELE